MTVLRIRLQRDQEGYPPFDSEQVLGTEVANHLFRLETTPVFAFGLACGDVVQARHFGEPQQLWVEDLTRAGGHSTIRVIVFGDASAAGVVKEIEELGGRVEETRIRGLLAVDIAPDVDLRRLEERLIVGQEEGRWDYNIGVLADGHQSATMSE